MSEPQTGRFPVLINPPVFFGSAMVAILLVAFTIGMPETASQAFAAIQNWIVGTAGWFYILSVAIFLVFVVLLAVSDYGRIRLGPDHSEPDYSYKSWFAMLFSAGMGIGLMFYGVAEPVMHMMSPPSADPETVAAARDAMRITFFHWGVHAWAIYAVVALALAYFAFRQNLPLTIRSALYPIIGEKIHGPIGHAVDIFAVLGTLFGVATSLGLGVIQVNAGLNYLLDVPIATTTQVILIVGITSLATISVVMGLDGGIRRISELNLILAIILLLFVLIAGPTAHLLETLVQNTGHYMATLVDTTFNLYAYEPTGWMGGWTLFYWGWWIAWSPFVGMFIARVSRGRTIREFIIGVLLVPVGFTFMWMTFFGNTGLNMIMEQGIVELGQAVSADASVALFQFFEYLPFSTLASTIAVILVITFFVTSSDSGSLVVDMLTSGGDHEDTPVWQRIFWALSEGAIAATLLMAGGLVALQTATIASALPFAVVMLFMCWGLFKSLRLEVVKRTALRDAMLAPRVVQNPVSWEKRLSRIIHQPSKQQVVDFLSDKVRPALEQVAAQFRERGLEAEVHMEEGKKVWIEVPHGDEIDFFYSVHARPISAPSFTIRDTRKDREEKMRHFRAEVYLKEGGQDYDVMGWTVEQLLADIIDQYEKHLHYLTAIR
ncbi:MAG: choline transporter [Oceanospirillaceae bacterium]|nr:choline transporter [Oceanospirillaceae bacterium]|tara:strand:- start:5592 stop:7574 length:1983 start_codon:yes stop_codon:yes gene_type:complete